MADLHELSERARQLAGELFRTDAAECAGQRNKQSSCLQKEEERPLTREEKKLGWARRPFDAYDPQRLCLSCRAYFCAELAAQALHRLDCLARREAALAAARG